ncbi:MULTISPECIES: peptidoglycan editing factor PgeF [unclassified Paenibacillus]|uniref:peptidoglycan editing factor PgeF n=1 Tax=unclassified Paenibacillus TaxID=185978 RepID=UPI0024058E6A|nr:MULTISPECIES: peptidoglycan editing factor PgeF [unclassified Paenibacillus]MDF9843203.1 YfiH family protein [Paenibacillus sp. PastF-2]MDF9849791.1 YfiH family protein [Paenibacillus sp. PastM-2]MDF9856498.1 YfiH family protein [Paenibacillus sp. PastF-1]MDH6481768.1 YfiH family protein [Paenibacillus sp. PastH-2]MDH6509142.1 YfiH family protein [Paenibacillus sp. PastM-3]
MEPFIQSKGLPVKLELEPWQVHTEITAGFTGRAGGAGKPPYDGFNCAFHVGDDPEDVLSNRRMLAESLGFSLSDWTCGEQTHGKHIAAVTAEDRGRGSTDRESAFPSTDGLVTNVPGVLLTSFYADCVPLYFYDPVRRAVGLAHAGWKGTVAEIAGAMVAAMSGMYGSRPEEIIAAIGPSIGDCCYEVDDYVMNHVRKLEQTLPDPASLEAAPPLYSVSQSDKEKSMLNLKEMNRRIMIKAGILPTHIECTTWCTSCNPDVFFSYRKEQGVTGRMTSWIGIKES